MQYCCADGTQARNRLFYSICKKEWYFNIPYNFIHMELRILISILRQNNIRYFIISKFVLEWIPRIRTLNIDKYNHIYIYLLCRYINLKSFCCNLLLYVKVKTQILIFTDLEWLCFDVVFFCSNANVYRWRI